MTTLAAKLVAQEHAHRRRLRNWLVGSSTAGLLLSAVVGKVVEMIVDRAFADERRYWASFYDGSVAKHEFLASRLRDAMAKCAEGDHQ